MEALMKKLERIKNALPKKTDTFHNDIEYVKLVNRIKEILADET